MKLLKVEEPLDFGLTGILAGISRILAENDIIIFAVSTYNADYILTIETDLKHAKKPLYRKAMRSENRDIMIITILNYIS